jgi:futalosine hydrolase
VSGKPFQTIYGAKLALHNGLDKNVLICSMNILLAAATEAEIAPFTAHLHTNWQQADKRTYAKGQSQVTVCITGVGMMATAYSMALALSGKGYDMAIQAGIAGSFDRKIALGELLYVTDEQLADLGAEDHDGYLDIFELGLLKKDEFPFRAGKLVCPNSEFVNNLGLIGVPALTVNTVSGNEQTIKKLSDKYNSTIESMEGAAFHYACLMQRQPFVQVRSVSNYIEPRDRSKWNIKDAITNLNSWLIYKLG